MTNLPHAAITDKKLKKASANHPPSGTLASSLYEQIRTDILCGHLSPNQRLQIEFIAERYNVGPTPAREALNRLVSDGCVELREQKGFAVAGVSAEDLSEIVKTRCWLEEVALRESIKKRTAEWEENILLAHHRLTKIERWIGPNGDMENPDWEIAHRYFHQSLIGLCGSRWLIRYCQQLSEQAYRYRCLRVGKVQPKRYLNDEHKAIAAAAMSGQTDDAIKLLVSHYQRTASIILEDSPFLI